MRLDGAESARPAPGVLDALEAADVVVLCPSNPVVSIGTILAVPGIRAALVARRVVGVSPVVGGRVVRGMADPPPALGAAVDAAAVARLYGDFLQAWVLDDADAGSASELEAAGIAVAVTDTIMDSPDVAEAVARFAVELAQ